MTPTDIALTLDQKDCARIKEAHEKGFFYVHKLNLVLRLLQSQLLNAKLDERRAKKGYRCTLTQLGSAVAKVVAEAA